MDKIAIGPGYQQGIVDLDAPPQENIRALAKAKAVKPDDITALILDRPRHADLIAAVREAGASVRLITDGDVAGVIHTADPESTGIDIYLGIGGAPEGVLAAGWCSTPKKSAPALPKWASRIRARNISWRTW
jgi:fructose-1,6-bisphosphatase II / sedoheptulose-1,7-bisphosphatase